ncbi:MAG: hypothetical protein CM1200mP2_05330 [Planctomycetaceae bacterium]|nr:MAG: hypothetical protein CM1200mP2_05330 [Planctomycetaceae bacterium]
MPPKKAKQPTTAERRMLVGWVTRELQRAERGPAAPVAAS